MSQLMSFYYFARSRLPQKCKLLDKAAFTNSRSVSFVTAMSPPPYEEEEEGRNYNILPCFKGNSCKLSL